MTEIGIQPLVNWPTQVTAGRSYLITVDLRLTDPNAPWPYDEEEFVIGCMLDGRPTCTVRTLGDAGVVLHRFGGSYGPARFLAEIPADRTDFTDAALWLTLTTAGGIAFYTGKLPLDGSPVHEPVDANAATGREVPLEPFSEPGTEFPNEPASAPEPIGEAGDLGLDDSRVYAVAAAELNGRSVAISGGDATIRVWDLASGELVGGPLTGHNGPVYAVATGERLGRPVIISGGVDGNVRVWDLASGQPVGAPLVGYEDEDEDEVSAVAVGVLQGRPVIISGGLDGKVRVWDLASGQPVGAPLTGHGDVVSAVAVGERLGRPVVVSGSYDRTMRVWDLATGEQVLGPLTGHVYGVDAMAVGERRGRPVVVSGSYDRTMRVWDLATGEQVLGPLTGHDDAVYAVAVAELSGRTVIVSGSGDHTVRVWDLDSGAPVGEPFTGHFGPVNALAPARMGGRPVVISGGGDATVRVWDLASGTQVGSVDPSVRYPDLAVSAQHMLPLMLRNMSSNSVVFTDPADPQQVSAPGCIIDSPFHRPLRASQNYVYSWTRVAALVAIELAASPLPTSQPLIDYVTFAQLCQNSAAGIGHFDRASFLINGTPRDWTDQTDGPALQTLAILQMFTQLDAPTQAVASAVITANVNFLQNVYQGETYNLWEEEYGASFFARSVQLKCFQAITANTLGIPVSGWLSTAIPWLENALQSHWNGHYYQSMLPVPTDKAPYDPNIDIVMAAIYGAVAVTDTKLLATAALLRSQWADPASKYFFPINGTDQQRGIGPLLGRYPGDVYDGDTDAQVGDHPWAVSTANFAELYYRLAKQVTTAGTVPLDDLSASFFSQLGVVASTPPAEAGAALRSAGDQMLQAIVFHSDHLELSEQFDKTTGYQKSVSNHSWSYASFLSATRARAQTASAAGPTVIEQDSTEPATSVEAKVPDLASRDAGRRAEPRYLVGDKDVASATLHEQSLQALDDALKQIVPSIFRDPRISFEMLDAANKALLSINPLIEALNAAAKEETQQPMRQSLQDLDYLLEKGQTAVSQKLSALAKVRSERSATRLCEDLAKEAARLLTAGALAIRRVT